MARKPIHVFWFVQVPNNSSSKSIMIIMIHCQNASSESVFRRRANSKWFENRLKLLLKCFGSVDIALVYIDSMMMMTILMIAHVVRNARQTRSVFSCVRSQTKEEDKPYLCVCVCVFFAVWLFCLVILNRTVAVKFIRIMVVKVVRR